MDGVLQASSYSFSWFAVPVLLAGALNWMLGILTLRRERGSPPSLTLLAMTFTIGVWLVGLGMAYLANDESVALFWIKVSMIGTVFVPVTAFMNAARGTSRQNLMRASVTAGVLLSTTLAILVLTTHLMLDQAHHYFWGYYPIYGPVGPVLIVYYGLFFVAGGVLYRLGHNTTKSQTERKRLRIRLAALVIAIPATVDFFATIHIGVYPFGFLFILGYMTLSTYSIWKYRLVDITPALAARQVTNSMAEALLVVDRDGVVRVANPAAETIWRRGKSLAGTAAADLDAGWGQDALVTLLDPDQEHERQVTYAVPDSPQRTVDVTTSKLRDHLGEWVGTVYILHDVTARWQAELAVRQSEERFRSLVQNASDLITVIDPDTTVRYQSPAVARILGYEADSVVGQKLIEGIHPDDQARFLASLSDIVTKPGAAVTGEGRIRNRSGDWRYLEFTGTDQRANPAIAGLVLNVRDVSERKVLEERLRDQALHDPLTKLANRASFADRLEHALLRRPKAGEFIAVLFMDVDNFKGVNDSLGHSAGDSLLKQIASRVSGCLRPADTVARLGGDEFAVLLETVTSVDDATAVADRIFQALEEPFDLEGKDVVIRASLGIATSQAGSLGDAELLLRDADIAMYAAKAHGKGCYRVFESNMQVSMMERLELLADLPRALQQGEFVLHYQPIFLLQSQQLFGVEALVRWQHPRRGLVPPDDFIPLAEESGAILGIGRWVLEEACRQAAEWQRVFNDDRSWTISVNVSAKQLQSAAFVAEVEEVLRTTAIEPRRLILEITEGVMMRDVDGMLKRMRELKALGVGLAIDDFGTGYSSLSYLREFPFDLLKIDKSFIDDLGAIVNPKGLTKAIIELGKTLDMGIVAEGIERRDQLARLQTLECELGQGFYFAHPLDAAAVEDLFRELEKAEAA